MWWAGSASGRERLGAARFPAASVPWCSGCAGLRNPA